jgi:hypothetical protein
MPAEATVIVTLWVDSAITPAYPVVIDHKAGFQAVALRSAGKETYITVGFAVWLALTAVFVFQTVRILRRLMPRLAELEARDRRFRKILEVQEKMERALKVVSGPQAVTDRKLE